jgi:hypothetical protein
MPYKSKFEEAGLLKNFILSTFLLSPEFVSGQGEFERPHTTESLEAAKRVNKATYKFVFNRLKKMESKGKRIKKVEGNESTNTIEVDYETKTGELKHKTIKFTPNGTYINDQLMRLDNESLLNKMRSFQNQFES